MVLPISVVSPPDKAAFFPHPLLEQSLLPAFLAVFPSPYEKVFGCQILLNTSAGSICLFRPAVVMSRDMLSYETGEIDRYRGMAWLRLIALRHVQNYALRRADGVIFLTKYAANAIQRYTGNLRRAVVIPHGVSDSFRGVGRGSVWPASDQPIQCLYVSNLAPYKHQWHVVRAVSYLRDMGFNVMLTFVGVGNLQAGGSSSSVNRFKLSSLSSILTRSL